MPFKGAYQWGCLAPPPLPLNVPSPRNRVVGAEMQESPLHDGRLD